MGMNWRKLSLTAISGILSASVIAGCATKQPPAPTPSPSQAPESTPAPAPAPAKKVELEFWGWWSSATRMPTINKIVDNWNQKNPNIQVKYEPVPFGDLLTKYMASVAAGNPPDVVVSPDIFSTPTRGQKKQAHDLSALGADSIKDQFYSQFWNAVQFQEKAYGLPWMGETKYLYYNKEMFAEVGLDPEKGPASWADLESFAAKLDKKEGDKYARIGFHPLLGNFGYHGWVWNAGSLLFDNRNFPTINTAKNVEVMDWVKKWTDKVGFDTYATLKNSGGGPQNPFITGKVAMLVETATWEGELKKNGPNIKYGIVPIPTPNGQQHQNASYSGGFSVEIPVGTKHPQEAFEFAKYWATEAAVIWAQEQNDFAAYNKAVEKITTPEFKRMSDNMKNTGLIPVPSTAPSYLDAVNAAVDDVLSNKKDAAKSLGDAQSAVTKMVQENAGK